MFCSGGPEPATLLLTKKQVLLLFIATKEAKGSSPGSLCLGTVVVEPDYGLRNSRRDTSRAQTVLDWLHKVSSSNTVARSVERDEVAAAN